jgi:hypothetical protein
MKTLNHGDFKCSQCGMPAEPGVCELCRLRVKYETGPSWTHYALIAAIGLISILVLVVGLALAARS